MEKELRICSCGRLHFIDFEIIETALKNDKDVLLICGRCGRATMIGADRMPDYWIDPDEEVYNMYSYNAGDESFVLNASKFENADTTKGIYQVIYSVGKGVPMNTGSYANTCIYGRFEDNWHPDFYHIERKGITIEEVMKFIDEWKQNKKTVNMARLLRELDDEELEMLSGYRLEGMDWKGTKYEKPYHG